MDWSISARAVAIATFVEAVALPGRGGAGQRLMGFLALGAPGRGGLRWPELAAKAGENRQAP